MFISIDFGITNTDILVKKEDQLVHEMLLSEEIPNNEFLLDLIDEIGEKLINIKGIAVTGGHHQKLDNEIKNIPIFHVNEIEAIGAGGIELSKIYDRPVIIVSAGSGTACVYANNGEYIHCSGTGIGGGTIIGLSKLIIQENDPIKIQELAKKGNHSNTDLILSDVITGPIGNLPPDTSAVNFGKINKSDEVISREDLAAGIINMVGQTIARIATSVAITFDTKDIVVIGRTPSFSTLRDSLNQAATITNFKPHFPKNGEYASALGAMLIMQKKPQRKLGFLKKS